MRIEEVTAAAAVMVTYRRLGVILQHEEEMIQKRRNKLVNEVEEDVDQTLDDAKDRDAG